MYFTHSMSLPLLCKEKRFTCRITLPQDLGYENQIVVQVNGINVLNTQKKKEINIAVYFYFINRKMYICGKTEEIGTNYFPTKTSY